MEARDLKLSDIQVGDHASFDRTFSEQDVQTFADLSGDTNLLHTDETYAQTTTFKHRLVHGMLVGSLCSTLVGMYLPGKRCLYVRQTLSFKKPVFIGDTITVFGTVMAKSEATHILTLSIVMKKDENVVLEGEAHVQVI